MLRIAVISRGSPHYLIDIVTDGLIRLLGRDSVALDYNKRQGYGNFAHMFQGFAGPEPFDLHEADALVASSRSIPAIRSWRQKAGKPIAYLEGKDFGEVDTEMATLAKVYFKREMLKGHAYPANVRPLSLAAIPEVLPPEGERKGVFYMGGDTHPVRIHIRRALTSMGHPPPSEWLSKEKYNCRLLGAAVGVAPRGAGWDTYRHWEVPYFGVALLGQLSPLVAPGNFIDGKEAVFFRDERDFPGKLTALLKDPRRTETIALAGKRAVMERHLSIHRAKTVLEALL